MFSFKSERQRREVQAYLSRICDLTTPNLAPQSDEDRADIRFNRSLPTLLCPWEEGQPCADEHTFALTKDVSDIGVGIVANQPIRVAEVVIGLWPDENIATDPWFFTGNVKRNAPIGGGFWILGIELTEFANRAHRDVLQRLYRLAARLRVPAPLEVG